MVCVSQKSCSGGLVEIARGNSVKAYKRWWSLDKSTQQHNLQEEMLAFCQMNLESLLPDHYTKSDIRQLAFNTIKNREMNGKHFEHWMAQFHVAYNNGEKISQTPFLLGWENNPIVNVREQYGGLLIGLFHYGAHRHVISDLIAQGIETIIPVAGQAYFGLKKLIPHSHASGTRLLEVEEQVVSRDLFKEIKSGKVGCIYIDGNMGPSTSQIKQGNQCIRFLDHKLSVKYGIARLSVMLKLPILPIFSSSLSDATVKFGELIQPNTLIGQYGKAKAQTKIMQSLYDQLAIEVESDPTQWEFATCLHRWVQREHREENITEIKSISKQSKLSVNTARIAELEHKGQLFWVHYKQARAFKIPPPLTSLFKRFYKHTEISIHEFTTETIKYEFISEQLLNDLQSKQLVQVQ